MSNYERQVAKLPSIRRLPLYLRALQGLKDSGQDVVSSSWLARELELQQIVVKKDLEITQAVGKTGVGYAVEDLISAIEDYLGWNNFTDAFLVGAGNLGQALLGYAGFREFGLRIVAAFDTNPDLIGSELHGVPVFDLTKLPNLAERLHVHLAVLTVPSPVAQDVCDTLVGNGVLGIWNFTPVKLQVPRGVIVRREDLASGLAELSVKIKHQLERGK